MQNLGYEVLPSRLSPTDIKRLEYVIDAEEAPTILMSLSY